LRRKFEACRIKPRFSAFLRVTAEEFEDAKSLWKFFYAHECFDQVENACSFILENSMDENRAGLSRRFVGSANRTFEFEKRGQLFIGTHPLFQTKSYGAATAPGSTVRRGGRTW
jgi:hypothetical protein